jgi:hypothetical protein
MSKNETGERSLRLNATGGPTSTQTTRVLRDDELDAVSGGIQNIDMFVGG